MLGKWSRLQNSTENTSGWQLFPQKPEETTKTILYNAASKFLFQVLLLQWAGLNQLNTDQEEVCSCILHYHSCQLWGKFLTLHPCLTPHLDGRSEEIKDWALESVTALWECFHTHCSRVSQDLNRSVLYLFTIYNLLIYLQCQEKVQMPSYIISPAGQFCLCNTSQDANMAF